MNQWITTLAIPAAIWAIAACTHKPEPGAHAPSVPLFIEQAAHFHMQDGSESLVAPGRYRLEPAKGNRLRLVSEEDPNESVVIAATPLNHHETNRTPFALVFSGEKADTCYVVLLLPDGQGLQAEGSYSGIRARATTAAPLSAAQLSSQVALASQRVLPVSSLPGQLFHVASQPDRVKFRETEDVFSLVHSSEIRGSQIFNVSSVPLPREAYSVKQSPPTPLVKSTPVRPRDKFHPLVKKWLAVRPPTDTEFIIVTLKETVRIPRFPEPAEQEPEDSDANRKVQARADELIRMIQAQRAPGYKRLGDELAGRYQARVVETFWLINAMAVHIPLAAIPALAGREDIVYLSPVRTESRPPQAPQPDNETNNIAAGRRTIGSDRYYDMDLPRGLLALLDTGLRFSHAQFNPPLNQLFRRDCVNGEETCREGPGINPDDDCWNHGTPSAGILVGNSALGDGRRGVSRARLSSYKVYPSIRDADNQCVGMFDAIAGVRAFQQAIRLHRTIVAEIQDFGNDADPIAQSADAAFDAGSTVIAANGNFGFDSANGVEIPGSVESPAIAHKAIGVGNFEITNGRQVNSQGRGPAPDGRIKPDIQAPTGTWAASNETSTALIRHIGSSGATPYPGGAATLLRSFMRQTSSAIDPGQVYAMLILSGQLPEPINNTRGAGPIRLPGDGKLWWGKVSVGSETTVTVSLPVVEPATAQRTLAARLDGALWWPESLETDHRSVEMSLLNPAGTVVASSNIPESVFQRARYSGLVVPGIWKLRIRRLPGSSAAPQTVYWAAYAS